MENNLQKAKLMALENKVNSIIKKQRLFSNQDVYAVIQWTYNKGRRWTDAYILPNLRWKTLKAGFYNSKDIGKYIDLDDFKRQLQSLLRDY